MQTKAGIIQRRKVQIKVKADVLADCVDNFCYLGDVIGARGGAEEACRNRVRNA